MKREQGLQLLEEIMELDKNTLSEEIILEDLEEWDSLVKLIFMSTVKKRLEKDLSITELRSFQIVGDILNYLID